MPTSSISTEPHRSVELHSRPARRRAPPDSILRPPGILGEVAEWVCATAFRPIPELATLSAITFGATTLGNTMVGPTGLSANIYATGIAPTGSGKDHCLKAVKTLLRHAGMDERIGGETLASGTAMLSRLARHANTVYLIDELGKYLAAVMNPKGGGHLREVADYMLKLSGALDPAFKGKDYADRNSRPTDTIKYPCLNVLGMTTANSFYGSLSRTQIEDGFLNRLLIVEIDDARMPSVNTNRGSQEPPLRFITWALAAAGRQGGPEESETSLRGIDPSAPIAVPYADAAAERILDDYLRHADDQYVALRRDGGGLEPLTRRWHANALKLALVAAASINPLEPAITVEAAQWAVDFTDFYSKALLDSVARNVTDSVFYERVQRAIEEIRKAGRLGLSRRDMVKKSRLFKSLTQREMDEVLGRVVDLGEVVRTRTSSQREAYVHLDNLPDPVPTGSDQETTAQ